MARERTALQRAANKIEKTLQQQHRKQPRAEAGREQPEALLTLGPVDSSTSALLEADRQAWACSAGCVRFCVGVWIALGSLAMAVF